MAKLTLLEMTQNILAAMDSDEVNSISDTVESTSVAEFIKEAYYQLMSEREWPFLRSLTSLTGLGDTDYPTKMTIPATINKIIWIKYSGVDVEYISPKEFKDLIDNRTVLADVVNADGYVVNADPQYWTTYDDTTVWFDGYDESVEATMTSANCDVYAQIAPSWTHTDAFVPDLPEKFFPTLLAEAKATCFINIKQQGNNREENRARRGRNQMQTAARREDNGLTKTNRNVDYGRK